VRTFYAQLLQAMPDLQIDIQHQHASEEAVILEVKIRGQHLGHWRSLVRFRRRFHARLEGFRGLWGAGAKNPPTPE